MPELALLISGRAKPGRRDALYALYLDLVVPHISASEQVRSVAWSADRDDEDGYLLFEIFEQDFDPRVFAGADWFREYTRHAEPLVADAAVVRRLETRWTKGI